MRAWEKKVCKPAINRQLAVIQTDRYEHVENIYFMLLHHLADNALVQRDQLNTTAFTSYTFNRK